LKTEILDFTFGEKPENRKNRKTVGKREKTKKNRYFTEIEPYLYEFDAIESRFGIYTRKTEESLFEI
jgi:hypothetical protein